jgi:hypothetical protein
MSALFCVCKGLKKLSEADPREKRKRLREPEEMLDRFETDLPLGNTIVATGHPDSSTVSEGLEIGATYRFEHYRLYGIDLQLAELAIRLSEMMSDCDGFPPGVTTRSFSDLWGWANYGGMWGPVSAARLVREFEAWDECAKTIGDEIFYEIYTKMHEVFRAAANDGLVFPFRNNLA